MLSYHSGTWLVMRRYRTGTYGEKVRGRRGSFVQVTGPAGERRERRGLSHRRRSLNMVVRGSYCIYRVKRDLSHHTRMHMAALAKILRDTASDAGQQHAPVQDSTSSVSIHSLGPSGCALWRRTARSATSTPAALLGGHAHAWRTCTNPVSQCHRCLYAMTPFRVTATECLTFVWSPSGRGRDCGCAFSRASVRTGHCIFDLLLRLESAFLATMHGAHSADVPTLRAAWPAPHAGRAVQVSRRTA